MTIRILAGHVLDRLAELPAQSVHCVVSSPPYFGLRSYGTEPQVWGGDQNCCHLFGKEARGHNPGRSDHGTGDPTSRLGPARDGIPGGSDQGRSAVSTGAFCSRCGSWRGDLGLEPTLDLYLDHMVEVMRAVRRVLRSDGTVWLNIGDSYAATQGGRQAAIGELPKDGKTRYAHGKPKDRTDVDVGGWANRNHAIRVIPSASSGFKPKDLMLIPWRLAIRLQDDGWFVRSAICWAKTAPMPESVTDRPTSSWEPVFLLSRAARYFYNAEAVKETATHGELFHGAYPAGGRDAARNGRDGSITATRNLRNVWNLSPAPFPDAHFATFPSEIPRRAIMAGTSEKGVCPQCAAPWVRQTSHRYVKSPAHGEGSVIGRHYYTGSNGWDGAGYPRLNKETETIGWQQSCSCAAAEPAPATVLDPFLGSGTTALVADQLQRNCIGIELNPDYAKMAADRIHNDAPLLATLL
jgi:DNA modification methylase